MSTRPSPSGPEFVLAYVPPALDPLARIARAYDRAVRACEDFDSITALEWIGMLREALVLDSPSAFGFDALYSKCETAVRAGDFMEPARTLRALRRAWFAAAQAPELLPPRRSPSTPLVN